MFTASKYTLWYYAIINSALQDKKRQRKLHHLHHIIPKSLGGSNKQDNVVLLTYREHYVCHLLLVKMTLGIERSKMVFAFFRFRPKNQNINSSKSFERFVSTFKKHFEGTNNPFYGKKHKPETLLKMSGKNHPMYGRSAYDIWVQKYGIEEAQKRRKVADDKRSKSLSGVRNPMYGKIRTPEQRTHQAILMSGKNNPNFGKNWCWISRNNVTKRVERHMLLTWTNDGWTCGRKITKPVDLVLGFHDDIENSKGTKDMLDVAKKFGVPIKLVPE